MGVIYTRRIKADRRLAACCCTCSCYRRWPLSGPLNLGLPSSDEVWVYDENVHPPGQFAAVHAGVRAKLGASGRFVVKVSVAQVGPSIGSFCGTEHCQAVVGVQRVLGYGRLGRWAEFSSSAYVWSAKR